jgi:hypothetical protein
MDLERVRRSRREGLLGLGQVLKSFRDTEIDYPQYASNGRSSSELRALGPMLFRRKGE